MLGDTGTFSNTIFTGYTSVPAGDTVVAFIENDAVLAECRRPLQWRLPQRGDAC